MALLSVSGHTMGASSPVWSRGLIRWRRPASLDLKRRCLVVSAAKERKKIDGATEQMNEIVSQNLDFAPARRRVREAFTDAQQKLDHFLFKTAPTGITMEENYDRNSKGVEVFWKKWLPRPGVAVKGTLFFCHGYGIPALSSLKGSPRELLMPVMECMLWTTLVLGYLRACTEKKEAVELPHFLLGQSMGGAVALKTHLKQPKEWDGVILIAPMCKIAKEVTPPDPILKVLTLLSYFLPEAKLFPQKDIGELAFRDPIKRKMADYNVVSYSDKMRMRTAIELLKATSDLESQLEKVSSPLLILHGAADKVTDPRVSEFLYNTAQSNDKTLKLYEGGYHSILEGEPDDRISGVITDIISWLDTRSTVRK